MQFRTTPLIERFKCTKHGEHDAFMTISKIERSHEVGKRTFCMICYGDFLEREIGQMEKLPD
jgi:hypothetical protein